MVNVPQNADFCIFYYTNRILSRKTNETIQTFQYDEKIDFSEKYENQFYKADMAIHLFSTDHTWKEWFQKLT